MRHTNCSRQALKESQLLAKVSSLRYFFRLCSCISDKIITNKFFFFAKRISLEDFCQGGLETLLQAAKKQECKCIYVCLGKGKSKITAAELAQITPNKYKTFY